MIPWRPLSGLLLISVLSGCWHPMIKPWDRDLLADPRMDPTEPARQLATEAKITFAREAARGGHTLGGGGCGCN